MAQASFTARPTSRAVAKAEHSEPTVQYRMAEDHRIKATPGIYPVSLLLGNKQYSIWLITVKPLYLYVECVQEVKI